MDLVRIEKLFVTFEIFSSRGNDEELTQDVLLPTTKVFEISLTKMSINNDIQQRPQPVTPLFTLSKVSDQKLKRPQIINTDVLNEIQLLPKHTAGLQQQTKS